MRTLRPRIISPSRFPLLAGLGVVLIAGGAFGAHWWQNGRFLQSTNNAYVQADSSTIAPRVSGYIDKVLVKDNQKVEAGQVLAEIDNHDLKAALAQAQADVNSAGTGIQNLDAQIALQQSLIAQAEAGIKVAQAGKTFAAQDAKRYEDLVRTGFGTVQKAQSAAAKLRQQTAQLTQSHAALAAARQQTAVLKTQRAEASARLAHNRAVLKQAELNLSYANITAPIDGTVGARSVRVGAYVEAGTALMAVVPLRHVYVVANFKETQLTHMQAGEPVTFHVDSFPGHVIRGRIDSIAPASGQEFALLPPDNATGNFTKIVQRIPVKIDIDANDPLAGNLRPGMSVEATVNTKLVVLASQNESGPETASIR